MTYEDRRVELAPFERAARIYCAKMKMDPDEIVHVPHPVIKGTSVSYPLWLDVADRLVEFSALFASLQQANAEAKKAEAKKDGEHGHA